MDRHSRREASSSEIEPWELDHARQVAKRFPDLDPEELAAELAVTILELKRQPLSHVRHWKAYLTQALFHRASALADTWRKQQELERTFEFLPEKTEPETPESRRIAPRGTRLWLLAARRRLDANSAALLELLIKRDFNQSLVARLKGVHRNTIRRQLDAIAQALRNCPIEKYSGRPITLPLTPGQRAALLQLARRSPRRIARRAELILSLGSGLSYNEIQERHHVTARTISLWRHRFATGGVEGLASRHAGKKPRSDRVARLTTWLKRERPRHDGRPSCRQLAQRFGTSKSTVQRVLKALHGQA